MLVSEDGLYGDVGRGIRTDSGPELVFALLRPWVGGTCGCGYRWSIDELSVLSEVDEGTTIVVGSGGFSEWLLFNDLNISRSPLIPSLLLLRFLFAADIPPALPPPGPLSSEGKVTVLLIASPHLHSLFTLNKGGWSDSSGIDPLPTSSAANDEAESAWFSISFSRTNWR